MSYYSFVRIGPASISLFQFLYSKGVLYQKDNPIYEHVDWHSFISKEEIDLAKGYLWGKDITLGRFVEPSGLMHPDFIIRYTLLMIVGLCGYELL